MGTQQIIALVIAGIVVVGGGWYVVTNNSGVSESTGSVQNESAEEGEVLTEEDIEEALQGRGSIMGLLGLGRNIQCTFSYTSEDGIGDSRGTVYLAGERMRGDFTLVEDGEEIESHMIRDGKDMYTWGVTPFGSMAVKMPIPDVAVENTGSQLDDDQGVDLDEDVDYECRGWRVDASKFVPPSDIEFEDIGAQMEQMQKNIREVQGVECSACDNIPDPNAQAQCRAALGCS